MLFRSPCFTTYRYGGTSYGPYPNGTRPNKAWINLKPATVVNPPANVWGLRPVTTWYRINRQYFYNSIGIMIDLSPGYPGGAYEYDSNGGACSYGQPGIGGWASDMDQLAINGALSKLKDQKVNLGVAFGEGKRTKSLILSAVSSFDSGVRKIMELRRGKVWKEVKSFIPGVTELPQEWLKYIYGFAPTLSDVQGAAEQFAKMMEGGNPFHIRVSKTITRSESDTRGWFDINGEFALLTGGWHPLYMDMTIVETRQAYFYYQLSCVMPPTIASLGLTNPLSVAYELLPWSFALDWLLPVGNWIDLLDADFGWSYLDGGVTRTKKVKGKGLYFGSMPNTHSVYSGSVSDMGLNLYEMSRTPYVAAPWPVFPGFRNPFRSGRQEERTATQIALVAQRLSKA